MLKVFGVYLLGTGVLMAEVFEDVIMLGVEEDGDGLRFVTVFI